MKKVLGEIQPISLQPRKSSSNLISGFKTCKICPVNVNELFKRIPRAPANASDIESTFLQSLEEKRIQWTKKDKKGRRKKFEVAMVKRGGYITPDDLADNISTTTTINIADASNGRNEFGQKRKMINKRILKNYTYWRWQWWMVWEFNEDTDSDFDINAKCEQYLKDTEEKKVIDSLTIGEKNVTDLLSLQPVECKVGAFIIFKYEDELFPGKILRSNDTEVKIMCMQKSLKIWKWPTKADEHSYPWDDVIGRIDLPISNGVFYSVHKLDKLLLI